MRSNLPKSRSLLRVIATLQSTIPATDVRFGYRRSERGTPNLHYEGKTNELTWFVDIYSGHYFRVRVGTETSQILKSLPILIRYLVHHLGVEQGEGLESGA